jgi:hypothetical protein
MPSYIELNSNANDHLQDIYYSVKENENQRIDIIKFYNHIFIDKMKKFIVALCSNNKQKFALQKSTILSSKPKINALAPESPLRENLPPSLLNYTTIYSSNCEKIPLSVGGIFTDGRNHRQFSEITKLNYLKMTPRTRALYAFGQSPSKTLHKINAVIKKTAQQTYFIPNKNAFKASLMGKILQKPDSINQIQKQHNTTSNTPSVNTRSNIHHQPASNFSFAKNGIFLHISLLLVPQNKNLLIGKPPLNK